MEEEITVLDLAAKSIKAINTDTVHKICSGQVVLSLAVAVKELLENSLDAGATAIDVKLKNYGIDMIEVTDNGTGVTEDNFTALTLKYHTSKLTDYSDLLGVTSFGFRGEALSSLCALANLVITTRHSSSTYATRIEYDEKGHILKKTPCSRQVGTTVTLSNLFHSLPVRQKEFHKNAKREFNKMTQLLYAYCLISIGVKITCTNSTLSNSKSVVVCTQGSSLYKDNIACIFGSKQLNTLLELKPKYVNNIKDNILRGLSSEIQEVEENIKIEDIEIDLSEDSNDADTQNDDAGANASQKSDSSASQGYKNISCPVVFTGFISSCAHGSGRSSTDRQFFFINSRPCEPNKIIKLINEVYRQFNPHQYPFVFLNVTVERSSVDVNVTPDKRKVFLTKEKILLDVVKTSLLKLFENIPNTIKMDGTYKSIRKDLNEDKMPNMSQPRKFNSFLQKFASKCSKDNSSEEFNINTNDLKRKSTTMLDFVTSKSMKTEKDEKDTYNEDYEFNIKNSDHEFNVKNEDIQTISKLEKCENVNENKSHLCDFSSDESKDEECAQELVCDNQDMMMYLESTDNLPNTQIRKLSEVIIKTDLKLKSKQAKPKKIVTDKEDIGKQTRQCVQLKTSFNHVKVLNEIYNKTNKENTATRVRFRSQINPVFNKNCEEELNREISKSSFKEMAIVGQFNLGFIITRLDEDLFIIDQHATDEIYNFETLQKTTEISSQKLMIPQKLELTGVNEQILMDNLETLKKNGFTFDIDIQAPPTKRVKLITLPMSKNWVFGKEDIEELLFMIRESNDTNCRPSRVRAMFASRACRKSVMIGTALSKADMKVLVNHMAEIDKPWNCPHGRPTIRHLINLAMVKS